MIIILTFRHIIIIIIKIKTTSALLFIKIYIYNEQKEIEKEQILNKREIGSNYKSRFTINRDFVFIIF